jgi:uncharacterized protein
VTYNLSGVGIGLRQPHYQQLLNERPALNFIEVHSENFFAPGGANLAVLRQVRAHYALSLHGVGLSLGSAAGLAADHLDQLAHLVAQVEPSYVSEHACFSRARQSSSGPWVHAHDLLPIALRPASLHILARNVAQVQDKLKRPILLENLSSYISWTDDEMSETDFFNELTRSSGCGLLLDVNNLVVNALNAAKCELVSLPAEVLAHSVTSACRWVDAIDADSVGEIHLAGYQDLGDIVIDDHGSAVHEPVWQVFRHTIERLGPRPTLVEWDTRIPPMADLLAQAYQAKKILAV